MTPVTKRVHVRVPATSANLGSGFDTAGLALEYFDDLTFTLLSDPDDGGAQVIIHGEGERTLPRDETHLVVSTFRRAWSTFGLERCGFTLETHNRIPQARGMGSSAEAIVAGIAAAAAFARTGEIDRASVFELAAGIEGHPDNVAPAVYGGLTLSWDMDLPEGVGSVGIAGGGPLQRGFHTVCHAVDPEVLASVFIPDVELSTERARQALPETVPYRHAIYNLSRVGLLVGALWPQSQAGQADPNALLYAATQDRLHQPYRKDLMEPSWSLIERLRSRGYAAAVSGAGPCVLVLHHGDKREAIEAAADTSRSPVPWRVLHLPVNTTGVIVERESVSA